MSFLITSFVIKLLLYPFIQLANIPLSYILSASLLFPTVFVSILAIDIMARITFFPSILHNIGLICIISISLLFLIKCTLKFFIFLLEIAVVYLELCDSQISSPKLVLVATVG